VRIFGLSEKNGLHGEKTCVKKKVEEIKRVHLHYIRAVWQKNSSFHLHFYNVPLIAAHVGCLRNPL